MIQEWHCDYIYDVDALIGEDCYVSSEPNSSTSPVYVSDAALSHVSFGLAILVCLMFLMTVGFMYNNMTDKKPWH